jgi:hypothetical protein
MFSKKAVVPMYDIEGDLTMLQNILKADSIILTLLDLTDKSAVDIAKRIVKRSQWNDLANSDKRLGIYPLPSRSGRNENLPEQMIEIACHVPMVEDFKARQVIARAVNVMNNKSIEGRYLKQKGFPGELPTMPGFYCFGCRFGYYDPIF